MKSSFISLSLLLLLSIICLVHADQISFQSFLDKKLNMFNNNYNKNNERNTFANGCLKVTCATQGQLCTDAITCINNTYCPTTPTPMCQLKVALGGACTEYEQCETNTCTSGICANSDGFNIENGQPCTTASSCASNVCTNGVCVGMANNATCSSDGMCESNFCNSNKVCADLPSAGMACDFKPEGGTCASALTCQPVKSGNSFTSVCVSEYSLAAGSYCHDNLGCGDNLACFAPTSGETYGICSTAKASSRTPCDSSKSNSCGSSVEECYCDPSSGNELCFSIYQNNAAGSKAIAELLNACYNGPCKNDSSFNCVSEKCSKDACTIAQYMRYYYGERTPNCQAESIVREFFPGCTTTGNTNGNNNGNNGSSSANFLSFSLFGLLFSSFYYLL